MRKGFFYFEIACKKIYLNFENLFFDQAGLLLEEPCALKKLL